MNRRYSQKHERYDSMRHDSYDQRRPRNPHPNDQHMYDRTEQIGPSRRRSGYEDPRPAFPVLNNRVEWSSEERESSRRSSFPFDSDHRFIEPPHPNYDLSLEPVVQKFANYPYITQAVQFLEDGLVEDESRYNLPSNLDTRNPFTYENFLDDLNVLGNYSFLVDKEGLSKKIRAKDYAVCVEENPNEDYYSLRRRQEAEYALRQVREGIEAFQQNDFETAMRKYKVALERDPKCAEALVARGAVYAKQEKYTKAIEDFKRALKLDPQHANAATYLEMTRRKSKEVEREKESAARGEFLMPADYDPRKESLPPKGKPTGKVGFISAASSVTDLSIGEEERMERRNGSRKALVSPPPVKRKTKKDKDKKRNTKKTRKRRRSTSSSSDASSEEESRGRKKRRYSGGDQLGNNSEDKYGASRSKTLPHKYRSSSYNKM